MLGHAGTCIAPYSCPLLPRGTVSVCSDASHGGLGSAQPKWEGRSCPSPYPKLFPHCLIWQPMAPATPALVVHSVCLGASKGQAAVERGTVGHGSPRESRAGATVPRATSWSHCKARGVQREAPRTCSVNALLPHGLARRQERTRTPCLGAAWVAGMSHSKAAAGSKMLTVPGATLCPPSPHSSQGRPCTPGTCWHLVYPPRTWPCCGEESGSERARNRRQRLAAPRRVRATEPAMWGWQEPVARHAGGKPSTAPCVGSCGWPRPHASSRERSTPPP